VGDDEAGGEGVEERDIEKRIDEEKSLRRREERTRLDT
jgi:hypothetical protein